MPRTIKKEPFFLIVVDSDTSEFTIEGPMLNDEQWNKAVCKAQNSGRKVRCFSTSSDHETVVRYHSKRGLALVEPGSIVQPEI